MIRLPPIANVSAPLRRGMVALSLFLCAGVADAADSHGDTPASKALADYLNSAKKTLHMQRSASGLLSHINVPGAGERPLPQDTVVLTLLARDLSSGPSETAGAGKEVSVRVSELVPGLREGVQMMAEGAEATFILPPELCVEASGASPRNSSGAPLAFTVVLRRVVVALPTEEHADAPSSR